MKSKKENPASFKKYKKGLWIAFASVILLIFFIFFGLSIGLFGFMPTFEELENPESNLASEVISSDNVLLGTYYVENRSNIEYSELSPYLIQALVSTEDKRFTQHSGIDFRSLARVMFKTVLGGDKGSGGGSTITQQLAKNLFPREKLSSIGLVFRKFKEWIIAVKLERNYTKEEIITMYFNTVDFGNNSSGIKIAASTFFDKLPKELDINESALLVGLLKAPTYYSPIRNPQNAKKRRNVVLECMMDNGYLSPEEFGRLSQEEINMDRMSQPTHISGLGTYFREMLRMEMLNWCKTHKKPNGESYNLYKDGLKIYTTLDSRLQRYAENAVQRWIGDTLQEDFFKEQKLFGNSPFVDIEQEDIQDILIRSMKDTDLYKEMKKEGLTDAEIMKEFKVKRKMKLFSWKGEFDSLISPWDALIYNKKFLHCGMMSIDPHTGFVKAYVGGINYKYFQFDNVSYGRRQVGSTFKPFVYTLAMQDGQYTPCTQVPNVPICIPIPGQADWCPKNSSSAKNGEMVTLKWALAQSVNYVSAYLIKEFSAENVVQLCRHMGITAPLDPVPSICLGTTDISVKEMVGAMATYANKGVYIKPIMVTRIEDKHGLVLDQYTKESHEAISEKTAYLMLQLMKGVVTDGSGIRLRYKYGLKKQSIAGKTGTSQNHSDGWFMGLTPDLVTGIWVGGDVRSVHFRSMKYGQGANAALPIWALYMTQVYNDSNLQISQEDFEAPLNFANDFDCDAISQSINSANTPSNEGDVYIDEM